MHHNGSKRAAQFMVLNIAAKPKIKAIAARQVKRNGHAHLQ